MTGRQELGSETEEEEFAAAPDSDSEDEEQREEGGMQLGNVVTNRGGQGPGFLLQANGSQLVQVRRDPRRAAPRRQGRPGCCRRRRPPPPPVAATGRAVRVKQGGLRAWPHRLVSLGLTSLLAWTPLPNFPPNLPCRAATQL